MQRKLRRDALEKKVLLHDRIKIALAAGTLLIAICNFIMLMTKVL